MFNKWIYLGLGSNIGNRRRNLRLAKALLSKNILVIKASKMYESKPWGHKKQRNFCNQVLKVDCKLNPYDLLNIIKTIERKLGKNKKFKWGPRTIDVDIIAFRNTIINRKELTVPHRFAHLRLFVIKPLVELDAKVKLKGKDIEEILRRLEGKDSLKTC